MLKKKHRHRKRRNNRRHSNRGLIASIKEYYKDLAFRAYFFGKTESVNEFPKTKKDIRF